ncbi:MULTISPECIES: acyl-CoA dehydrogenase family protein [Halomonadaceae]|uniref:Acyl-CoA dehydrogenase family protein n=2 Tax=Vreelandella TaxID=3137766 RepID=A0A7Z0RWP5_9GAMM|nr:MULTISPECIES: acyl-CoA dehydrogenase family protein [Halomonas]NYS76454.1 acyl-CoA dehydrogenase family protein [Halomonas glaciei]
MDFSISEEQLQLRDAVKRFCDGEYPPEMRGQQVSADMRRERWGMMAELGLIGLAVSETCGGSDLGMVEQMGVLEELGRCLSPEPYLSTAVISGSLINALGTSEQQQRWLAPIAMGQLRVAFALDEPRERYAYQASLMECRLTLEGEDYRLSGEKSLVLDGADADAYVVAAQHDGALQLLVVPADAVGLTRTTGSTLDSREIATLCFADVLISSGQVLAEGERAECALQAVLDRTSAALCAESVGAMTELVEQTREFLKVRKQFGAVLGKFQVLQHRFVDMVIALEQSRSMAAVAAMAVDEADAEKSRKLVSAARVSVARAARLISKEAVQMHGAMGMTDECQVGHYVKRLMVAERLFGDISHQLQNFAKSTATAA